MGLVNAIASMRLYQAAFHDSCNEACQRGQIHIWRRYGIFCPALHWLHHRRAKVADRKLKDLKQESVLTFKEVIQAPRIHVGFPGDSGHASGVKALYMKMLKGRTEYPFFGFRFGRQGELSDRSSFVDHIPCLLAVPGTVGKLSRGSVHGVPAATGTKRVKLS